MGPGTIIGPDNNLDNQPFIQGLLHSPAGFNHRQLLSWLNTDRNVTINFSNFAHSYRTGSQAPCLKM